MATNTANWDPFSDSLDVMKGLKTEYGTQGISSGSSRSGGYVSGCVAGNASPAEVAPDWDPFADHEMILLTGDIAMASDDVDAIEAWIKQAELAKITPQNIQPKRDRIRDLQCRKKDEGSRKKNLERLEKAMMSQDREALREQIAVAVKGGVHPGRVEEAKTRLEELKRQEAARIREEDARVQAEREEKQKKAADEAMMKLAKADLLPASVAPFAAELREEEHRALSNEIQKFFVRSKEGTLPPQPGPGLISVKLCFASGDTENVEVNPSDKSTCLLTKLLPLRKKHQLADDFAFFLPNGALLQLTQSLESQGVKHGTTLRVDDPVLGSSRPELDAAATEAAKAEAIKEEEEQEKMLWSQLFEALACEKPPITQVQASLKRHKHVVLIGWNATEDESIKKQVLETAQQLHGTHLILTGTAPCKFNSPKVSHLPFSSHSRLQESQVNEFLMCLESVGISDSFLLVIVSRNFQCKRICYSFQAVLSELELPEEALWAPITIMPCPKLASQCFLEEYDLFKEAWLQEAALLDELKSECINEAEGAREALVKLPRIIAQREDHAKQESAQKKR